MTIAGGRFDLWHDYDALIRFVISNGAGASAASLRIAPSAESLPGEVDLLLSTGGGEITLTDDGLDCRVDARFVAVPGTLAPGMRYFELSLSRAGQSKVVKTGCAVVRASLAA